MLDGDIEAVLWANLSSLSRINIVSQSAQQGSDAPSGKVNRNSLACFWFCFGIASSLSSSGPELCPKER